MMGSLLVVFLLAGQISLGFGTAPAGSGVIEAPAVTPIKPGTVRVAYRTGEYRWQVVNPPGHQILVAKLADGRTLLVVPAGVKTGVQIDLIGVGKCDKEKLPEFERLSFLVSDGPAPGPGPGPDPGPGPEPNPVPPPVIPNEAGVGQVAWDALQQVPREQRVKHAARMASIWESAGSRLAADARLTVPACVDQTRELFVKELGSDLAQWATVQDSLSNQVVKLQVDGKLDEAKPEGWVKVFNELATVFKLAAK